MIPYDSIHEGADVDAAVTWALDGVDAITFNGESAAVVGNLSIAATKKLHLDGGGDTYLTESAANILDIYVGGNKVVDIGESSLSINKATSLKKTVAETSLQFAGTNNLIIDNSGDPGATPSYTGQQWRNKYDGVYQYGFIQHVAYGAGNGEGKILLGGWTGAAYETRVCIDNASGGLGIGKEPSSKFDIDLATEDFEIVDAGSVGATEQDWIEVEVGGNQGYIRVFAAK